MKKALITFIIAIFTGALAFADSNEPDCMYIHFTTTDGADSVVAHTLANIDSIVYYASVVTEPDYAQPSGTFTDSRDGKTYKWVTIGTQTWMAENLCTTQYPDGTAIPYTSDGDDWADLGDNDTDDAYCAYDNSTSNATTYGYLYTYAAALSACPTGWHLPSDDEWKTLEMYIGMSDTEAHDTGWRGTDEGKKLKSTSGWNNSGNGTDDYGFAALPGGSRNYSDGTFYFQGGYGGWWSSTQYGSSTAYYRYLYCSSSTVIRNDLNKSRGYSVRCVRD